MQQLTGQLLSDPHFRPGPPLQQRFPMVQTVDLDGPILVVST